MLGATAFAAPVSESDTVMGTTTLYDYEKSKTGGSQYLLFGRVNDGYGTYNSWSREDDYRISQGLVLPELTDDGELQLGTGRVKKGKWGYENVQLSVPNLSAASKGKLFQDGEKVGTYQMPFVYNADIGRYEYCLLYTSKQGGNGCIGTVDSYDLYRSDDKSIFKDFGSDFGLTSVGLAEVNKNIEFENIDMSSIGLRTAVGGTEPTVANLTISGNKAAGGVVRADYDFVDPDGDSEGISKISWYTVDKRGNLTPLGRHGRELKIEKEWEGMKISYSAVSYTHLEI